MLHVIEAAVWRGGAGPNPYGFVAEEFIGALPEEHNHYLRAPDNYNIVCGVSSEPCVRKEECLSTFCDELPN